MESNPHHPSKSKRGLAQLKPLIAAIARQGDNLTRRRRSPTMPLPITSVPTTSTPITPPQPPPAAPPTASIFLTLPVEIRARVYHFVFAGREVVLFEPRNNNPMVASTEIDPNLAGGKWRAGWWGLVKRPYPEDDQYLEFKQEPGLTGKLLGLALCCHQVHDESIRFLYASTGFTVQYLPLLDQFVVMDGQHADYMRWMRVLRLDYEFAVPIVTERFDVRDQVSDMDVCIKWEDACRCLELMTMLKVLHITIYPHGELVERYYASDMVWEMLELLKMARADEYRVSVRKPFMNLKDNLVGAPFVLCEVYEDLYL